MQEKETKHATSIVHWRGTPFLDSKCNKRISFHVSGTPGRHQWLQSGTDGLSLQVPTCASLRYASIGVTWRTVTGTVIFFTTLIMTSEIGLRSLPWDLDEGSLGTLQEFRFLPLTHTRICFISQSFCKGLLAG